MKTGRFRLKANEWDKKIWRETSLFKALIDRTTAKERIFIKQTASLSYDLIYKIFILLPAKSVHRLSFVCKEWLYMVTSSNFIEAHASQCETVLVFLMSKSVSQKKPHTISVDGFNVLPEDQSPCIHFLDLLHGKCKIEEPKICGIESVLATCNGLILAISEGNNLLVINPITRKQMKFPHGTVGFDETYGFFFSQFTKEYNVIHLFCDDMGYIGCEILSLNTSSWKAIDGFFWEQSKLFQCKPVAVASSLYWLPGAQDCDKLVCLDINEQKFCTMALPVISSTFCDRLIEIAGALSFVTRVTENLVEVLILNRNPTGHHWTKQYDINLSHSIMNLVPVYTSRNGQKMVFEARRDRDHLVYVYDFETEEMKEFFLGRYSWQLSDNYFPHLNTLVSWEPCGRV